MAFAIANAPQVYDECDHNVTAAEAGAAAWLPQRGRRAVPIKRTSGTRCAEFRRIAVLIATALYGTFCRNSEKVMSGTRELSWPRSDGG